MICEPKRGAERVKAGNRSAWIAPFMVLALLGYLTWAMVSPVTVDRFLTLRRDVPTAISVLVTFFILLFMTLVSWFRILILAHTNPGYVPKGPNFYKAKSVEAAHAYYSDNMEKLLSFEGGLVRGFTLTRLLQFNGAAPEARARQASQEMPSTKPAEDDLKNLDYMLGNRNTFVCNSDGRLGWCEECYNWKPERAHHCSDTGRCVLRMDHFCPWISGVVSATTFKFFIQFTFYNSLLCFFSLATTAVAITSSSSINPHHIVLIALAGFFGFFTLVLCGKGLHHAFHNITGVEWEYSVGRQYHVATYLSDGSVIPGRTVQYGRRSFLIVALPVDMNPFDMGWRLNFCSVMGTSLPDWLLPVRHSPCLEHPHDWSESPMRSSLFQAIIKADPPAK